MDGVGEWAVQEGGKKWDGRCMRNLDLTAFLMSAPASLHDFMSKCLSLPESLSLSFHSMRVLRYACYGNSRALKLLLQSVLRSCHRFPYLRDFQTKKNI